MNVDNLITMANQIGAFYETMPDRAHALNDIADHLRKFWEPRMRRELLAHLAQSHADHADAVPLSPVVIEAVRMHHARLAENTGLS